MEADAVGRQSANGVIEGLDADHGELLVVLDARLWIDHVPVLGDRRIVELKDQAGVDDRLVFLAHGFADRVHEFFVAFVMGVRQARCARRRDGGHEAFLHSAGFQRRLEMGDVGLDGVVALVDDRGGADRPFGHWRPGINAAVGILVDRQEARAVAALGKTGQHDLARLGLLRLGVVQARARQIEAAEAVEAITPPGPVIDLVPHRFAELAVAGNVDADFFLLAHDVDHGRPQGVLKCPLVGPLTEFVGAVRINKIIRPR